MRKQLISIGKEILKYLNIGNILNSSDPHHIRRTANHISWYADGGRKIAVSYCNLEFQSATNDSFIDSYIWDIGRSFFSSKFLSFIQIILQKIQQNLIFILNLFHHWFALNSIQKIHINLLVVVTMVKFVSV